MAALRERKSKGGIIYYVDYVFQGKRDRKSTKTSDRKLAELVLKDIEVKMAKDEFGFNGFNAKRVKLSGFFDKFLEFSRATKAENTALLDQHVQTVFARFTGDIALNGITARKIEEFKVHRLTRVKATSVNLELRHLKAMFETGVKWGHITSNPFKQIKQIKVRGKNLPKYLSRQDIQKVLDAIPNGQFKNLILFYLYTGCRRGEALKMHWNDVDMKAGQITIKDTKSGKSRVEPIHNSLLKMLTQMSRNGNCLFNFKPSFVSHKFKHYLKCSGVKGWKHLHLHSLRHTFASHLVMRGTDLYTVAKFLGHSSVAVTQMYAHLAPDYLKTSMDKLEY